MDKRWYSLTVEHYSTIIKRNEIPIYVTTWITLETLHSLKEVSYKKPYSIRFYLFEMPRIRKSIGTKGRLVVT